MAANIIDKLQQSRRELLDMGMRNTLLNHRTLKARGLDIIDEKAAQVFDLLVRRGRAMTFVAASEEPTGDGDPQSLDPKRHSDAKLQTPHPIKQLESRLLQTASVARGNIEEQGVNILFLAIGFLEWREAGEETKPRRAPLLLVPVRLERGTARERFKLVYTDEDIDGNLSLREKLASEFQVELPMPPEVESLDVDVYTADVAEAVAHMPGWRVEPDAMAVGFFSFAKFLMYKDLQPEGWKGGVQETLLGSLLGGGTADPSGPAIGDEEPIDQHLSADGLSLVMDADSSQTQAILEIVAGRSLVIQGPPGTGKSQTITNMVAAMVGAGKTVLFVAEKMAALEVVKRRLDQMGLGDACLELHSHKSNRREVIKELGRTIALGRPRPPAESVGREWEEARARLNVYSTAVNTPVGASGLSPIAVEGHLLRARARHAAEPLPRVALPAEVEQWTAEDARRRTRLAGESAHLLAEVGNPHHHPFHGAQLTTATPAALSRCHHAVEQLAASLLAMIQAATALNEALGRPTATSQNVLANEIQAARQLAAIDPALLPLIAAERLYKERTRAAEAIAAGERLDAARAAVATGLVPAALEADLAADIKSVTEIGGRWWRFLSSSYRGARRSLMAMCAPPPPQDNTALLERVGLVAQLRADEAGFAAIEPVLRYVYGDLYNPESPDWGLLRATQDGVVRFHSAIARGEQPAWALEAVRAGIDQEKLKRLADAADKAASVYTERAAEFVGALLFDPSRRGLPREAAGWEWAALGDMLDRMEEAPDSLGALARFNHAAAALAGDGLAFLLPLIGQWAGAATHLAEFVQYCWHQALMERAFRERPVLANFHARTHDELVGRFRELDRQVLHAARDRVVAQHWQGLPRAQSGEGQLGILLRETQKKTRHLPIRQLLSQAGRAVQALKPVFLMSPMSVAAFLAPDSVQFDLVVFDEASQVQPVDAFGAILRGRQLVVVGDRHQLPPTRFFERIAAAEAEIEEEEEESLTADLESLLGLCTAQQMRECMLRWHYRSRHQSLISTSNRNFYDNRLYIFPSPAPSAPGALGLVFHHVSEGVYDRGKSRKNRIEADRVVDAIYEHLRTNPGRTLGVATFSVAQADAITDALEARRRDDPTGEEFFNAHPHEPFFVKNLESVQGDERDVILISVGYGRDAAGKLTNNFGPLNGQGGERRLNVLITRARCRCEVFCNFRGAELDLTHETPRGVQVLREFLVYAEEGRFPVAESAGAEPMSPFEEAVRDAITARGWRVDCQVGSAGYFIDLAVEDPAAPGAYLLAIECDGASYHRARSARDRDRLRQQVLEGLGWRFHRIWSTDWFMAPERELERVIEAIEKARLAQGHLPSSAPVAPPPPERSTAVEPSSVGRNIAIYTAATPTINIGGAAPHEVPPSALVPAIREIVAVEGPVSRAVIAQRVLGALGRRATTRATAAVEAAITVAAGSKAIVLRGDFAWPSDASPALPRDRSGAEAAIRAADAIAPEEWLEAIAMAVAEAHGIPRDRVVNAVASLIGVRVTEEARAQVDAALQRGAAGGRLRVQDGTVLVVTE